VGLKELTRMHVTLSQQPTIPVCCILNMHVMWPRRNSAYNTINPLARKPIITLLHHKSKKIEQNKTQNVRGQLPSKFTSNSSHQRMLFLTFSCRKKIVHQHPTHFTQLLLVLTSDWTIWVRSVARTCLLYPVVV